MPARFIGLSSTFDQQRQVINAISEEVYNLLTGSPNISVGFLTASSGIFSQNVSFGSSVGIGTTNPQKSLHISGVGTQSGGIRLGNLDFFAFGADLNAAGSPTFRNSQTNGSTVLRVLPNGTGNAQFEFFGTDLYQDFNAWDNIRIVSSSTEFRIDAAYAPGGVAKPLRIETNVGNGGGQFNNPYQLYLATNGNIGIGSSVPTSKLEVQGGDIRVGVNTSHGLILTSPNGTRYRLIVDNSGVLSTTLA